MKPNSFEDRKKFTDPTIMTLPEDLPMDQISMMAEADRKAIPSKGKGGKYQLLESRRPRPASAFQTMTQMAGMYVKRAPGGVPEPVDIDYEPTEMATRPATAGATPDKMGSRARKRLAEDLTVQGEDNARSGRWHKACI